MNIGIATLLGSPVDSKTWSGTPKYISRSLVRHGQNVSHYGPFDSLELRLSRVRNKLRKALGLPRLLTGNSSIVARTSANHLNSRLEEANLDALICPAGSAVIAELKTKIPIVYTSDTTFRLIADYYPSYSKVSRRARAEADALEKSAMERADLLIYPTQWAADSAEHDYDVNPRKILVQPYGANLDEVPSRAEALRRRREGPVRLLFVGVDWQRKGGNIVVSASDFLTRRGIDNEITVIGCVPSREDVRENMRVFPFLNKNFETEMRQFVECFIDADLFVLPTRMECYGIAFCEALAYGKPCIATATGGVPEVVRDGETGYCLPMEAEGPDFADVIEGLVQDPIKFLAMREAARMDYENRLNWDVWAMGALDAIKQLGSPQNPLISAPTGAA